MMTEVQKEEEEEEEEEKEEEYVIESLPSSEFYSVEIKTLFHTANLNATASPTSPSFVGLSLCIFRSL
jgi:hypothetical protein